jgi:ubiquinone/menaquinone biosynthesis methyltransferase
LPPRVAALRRTIYVHSARSVAPLIAHAALREPNKRGRAARAAAAAAATAADMLRLLQRRQALAGLTAAADASSALSTRALSAAPGDAERPADAGAAADGADGADGASTSAPGVDFGFRQVPHAAKQGLVREVFSSVAPSYDAMNDLMSVGLHRLWKDHLVDSLAVAPSVQHLDVAGGTGDVAFRVAAAARAARAAAAATGAYAPAAPPPPPARVVVCDINPEMLAEGRKRAGGAEGVDLEWVEGNAEALPFPDAAFDSYTVAFGIRNVTDRPAALAEARRVLRPGGRLLVLEFAKVTAPGLRQLYDASSLAVIPRVGALVAGDAESYRYLVESIRMFPPQAEFADMLRAAGFVGVRWEDLSAGIVAIHSGTAPRA